MPKNFPMNAKGFHPFAELIGLDFTRCEDGFSHCQIEINDTLLNPHGVVHGGVIYSMADTGMGGALYTALVQNELCATIEIKINYFKATKSGLMICKTRIVHKGKKVATLESEILNEETLIAKALGTYSIFNLK